MKSSMYLYNSFSIKFVETFGKLFKKVEKFTLQDFMSETAQENSSLSEVLAKHILSFCSIVQFINYTENQTDIKAISKKSMSQRTLKRLESEKLKKTTEIIERLSLSPVFP